MDAPPLRKTSEPADRLLVPIEESAQGTSGPSSDIKVPRELEGIDVPTGFRDSSAESSPPEQSEDVDVSISELEPGIFPASSDFEVHRVPVYICAPSGKYEAGVLDDLVGKLLLNVTPFYARESSGRVLIEFVRGSIVSPVGGQEEATFERFYNYGSEVCKTPIYRSETHAEDVQPLVFVDTNPPGPDGFAEYGGFAWIPIYGSESSMDYSAVAHELAHSLFYLGHTNQNQDGKMQECNEDIAGSLMNVVDRCSRESSLVADKIICKQRRQLGWLCLHEVGAETSKSVGPTGVWISRDWWGYYLDRVNMETIAVEHATNSRYSNPPRLVVSCQWNEWHVDIPRWEMTAFINWTGEFDYSGAPNPDAIQNIDMGVFEVSGEYVHANAEYGFEAYGGFEFGTMTYVTSAVSAGEIAELLIANSGSRWEISVQLGSEDVYYAVFETSGAAFSIGRLMNFCSTADPAPRLDNFDFDSY